MSSPSPLQWLSLVGTVWLQTFNGANSDFSVYSSELKRILSISQVQLNNLAFASDAGKLLGWFSGIAAIYLPLWLVLLIGATFGLIGYGVQFLFLAHIISSLSYWHVIMLTAIAGHGICWINTVCYLVCIRNFRSDSRVAVGLSTSYVGLSAKVFNVLADTVFHPQPGRQAKAYLFLNAVAPMLVASITASFLRVVEVKDEARPGVGFVAMFVVTVATGICVVVGSIGSVSSGLSSTGHMLSLGVLMIVPLLVPMAVKIRDVIEEIRWSKRERRIHDMITIDEGERGERVREEEVKDNEGGGRVEDEAEDVGVGVGVGAGVGAGSMLRKVDFWLYFFTYMSGATLGLVFLNNLGQIAESRGLSTTSSLVSLSSSFGFFGRLVPAIVDYHFSKSGYMVSRPASIATLMVPLTGAFFMLLSSSNLSLYVATMIIGATSGAITSIAVSATPELFGTKHFGVNHNIVVTNIPIGSLLFGYLAAILYQRGDRGGSGSCFGAGCYRQTFIIWGSTCAFGTLLCVILYLRTRTFQSSNTSQLHTSHP